MHIYCSRILFSAACTKNGNPSGNNNGNGNGGTTNSLCKEFEIKSTSQGGQDGIYTFNAAGQLQAYKGELYNSPSIFLLALLFPFFIL